MAEQVDMGQGRTFTAEFGGVNQSDHTKQLAQSIASREQEIYHYQVNINNFQAMLDGMTNLPAEWPENLLTYRTWDRDRLIATLDDATLELVTGLLFRDQIRMRIRTERIEQQKAKLVLASLKTQIVDVNAVKTEIADEKAKQNAAPVA